MTGFPSIKRQYICEKLLMTDIIFLILSREKQDFKYCIQRDPEATCKKYVAAKKMYVYTCIRVYICIYMYMYLYISYMGVKSRGSGNKLTQFKSQPCNLGQVSAHLENKDKVNGTYFTELNSH